LVRLLARVATLGYAVPGTVLAVGIFVPIAWLDNVLIEHFFVGQDVTAVLKGTLAVMLLAYVSRFLAVGYSAVDAAMNRITRSQEEAARNLGYSGFALLRHVHLPLLQGGLLTGVLMVFVDVMKEMPITMMTRPFGWDTLAVRIYGLTSEGVFDQAALPAVVLVLVGLIPTLLLSRQKDVA
jgi:iron(III) transport system permease protein